jgi:hypothetical protein
VVVAGVKMQPTEVAQPGRRGGTAAVKRWPTGVTTASGAGLGARSSVVLAAEVPHIREADRQVKGGSDHRVERRRRGKEQERENGGGGEKRKAPVSKPT